MMAENPLDNPGRTPTVPSGKGRDVIAGRSTSYLTFLFLWKVNYYGKYTECRTTARLFYQVKFYHYALILFT